MNTPLQHPLHNVADVSRFKQLSEDSSEVKIYIKQESTEDRQRERVKHFCNRKS